MIPPAVLERGVRVAEGAHVGSLVVLGEDVSIGAGTTVERAVILNGAPRSARAARCATASSRPAARVGARTPITGGAVLGEGVTVGADNVIAHGARIFPGVDVARRRDQVLAFSPDFPIPQSARLPYPSPTGGEQQMSEGAASATPTAEALSREAIARVDLSDQLGDVLALPEHLRDALWRVESAIMQDWDTSAGLVVAGMGGSAIGGALARAALSDHATRPIFVTRAYGLPPWTTPDTMVLCASYSGDTEETLACYESAGALGARRTVVTTGGRLAEMARADGVPVIPLPGGFQPRAAVAYMTVAALEVAALCGAGPRLTSEIDVAASHTEQLVAEWGPDAPEDSLAKDVARGPARHDAGDRRRRADHPDRLPLEDPDQRERQAAGLRARTARARPQRDRRLGGSAGRRALLGRVPRRLRRPPAREGADGPDRAPDDRRQRRPRASGWRRAGRRRSSA